MDILVENIKCGGCANTIQTRLKALEGVCDVTVNVEEGKVSIDGEAANRDLYINAVANMGYPEIDSVEGLDSVGAKARSFVSCAIGRMKN
ncbi:MAG: heavy-metal-associated domain-containing protein [Gammaproteobacteria bacterium]|nr:heavy-metal-associated domain-containing protein [Gammaproteobacteria bacterium]